ncbi:MULTISPECIES: DUF3247 family protein [unclassified Luteimonas]
MGQNAERVYTSDADIARLEALVQQLPDEARVELLLADGSSITGAVVVRPTVQTFRGPDGSEGINGRLRVDDAGDPARSHLIWLDVIREVRRLDPIADPMPPPRSPPREG